MKRRVFLSAIAAASVASNFRTSSVIAQRRTRSALDLEALLAVTEVPSIAVAGIIRGREFQRVAGVASVADRVLVTPDTLFTAASLSKPVFAWGVRTLISAGKLEWSKPLQDYLNLGLNGDAKRITAEHVLTHSTGLPNWRFQLDRDLASAFVPGSRWQYSGEGFFLLQRVVEKVSGKPIAAFMKQAVLIPLGMTASTYAWTPELEKRAASGHDRRGVAMERAAVYYEKRNYDVLDKAGLQPEAATYDEIRSAYEKAKVPPLPIAMSPNMAGSLWTTAPDYATFLKHVIADVPKNSDDYRARVNVNPRIAWTLGWGVDSTFRRPALFHWGDGPGAKNFTWVQPEQNTALVFFTNGDHGQQLYSAVFRQVLAVDPAVLYWL